MANTSASTLLRITGAAALAAAFVLPLTLPSAAHAWWRGGWGWHGGIYIAPPLVVAPPAYYAPPPYYAAPPYYAPPVVYAAPAPGAVWIAPAWIGGVFVRGHWR